MIMHAACQVSEKPEFPHKIDVPADFRRKLFSGYGNARARKWAWHTSNAKSAKKTNLNREGTEEKEGEENETQKEPTRTGFQ